MSAEFEIVDIQLGVNGWSDLEADLELKLIVIVKVDPSVGISLYDIAKSAKNMERSNAIDGEIVFGKNAVLKVVGEL